MYMLGLWQLLSGRNVNMAVLCRNNFPMHAIYNSVNGVKCKYRVKFEVLRNDEYRATSSGTKVCAEVTLVPAKLGRYQLKLCH